MPLDPQIQALLDQIRARAQQMNPAQLNPSNFLINQVNPSATPLPGPGPRYVSPFPLTNSLPGSPPLVIPSNPVNNPGNAVGQPGLPGPPPPNQFGTYLTPPRSRDVIQHPTEALDVSVRGVAREMERRAYQRIQQRLARVTVTAALARLGGTLAPGVGLAFNPIQDFQQRDSNPTRYNTIVVPQQVTQAQFDELRADFFQRNANLTPTQQLALLGVAEPFSRTQRETEDQYQNQLRSLVSREFRSLFIIGPPPNAQSPPPDPAGIYPDAKPLSSVKSSSQVPISQLPTN